MIRGALGMMAEGGKVRRQAGALQRAGRHGDTELVHISPEELELLRHLWGEPTINTETGLPEYFSFGKLVKRLAPAVAAAFLGPAVGGVVGNILPAAASWAPTIGGALTGAGTGALFGGAKGALIGGLTGGLTSFAMPYAKDFLSGTSVDDMMGIKGAGFTGASNIDYEALDSGNPSSSGGAEAEPGWVERPSDPLTVSPGSTLSRVASAPIIIPAAAAEAGTSYKTPLLLGGGALALAAMQGKKPQEQGPPPGFGAQPASSGPTPDIEFDREYIGPITATPYYTYGTQPFSFFRNNRLRNRNDDNDGEEGENMARGGPVQGAPMGLSVDAMYTGSDAPGDGRDDTIPAQLSNNEYVMDAETLALLGDGSPDAGADQMDRLRENIRKHKGKALAKGKISPNAKPAAAYLPKGRR